MNASGELIRIDGKAVTFQKGQTVLQAALDAGFGIPHLCYRPELSPIGSCRLCLVETADGIQPSCTLKAAPGQEIISRSGALQGIRQALVEMLLARGRHYCTSCERTGDCRLQDAAVEVKAAAVPYQGEFPPRDDSHPDVILNRDRCILCGICVKASLELDGKNVFAFASRGNGVTLAVESPSGLLCDSSIGAEDQAVRLCPTGALVPRAQQEQGFSSFFDTFG